MDKTKQELVAIFSYRDMVTGIKWKWKHKKINRLRDRIALDFNIII